MCFSELNRSHRCRENALFSFIKGAPMRGISAVAALAIMMIPFSASAADLPVKAPAPAAATHDWAGFYLGGNVGYGYGVDAASTYNAAAPGPLSYSDRYPDGALGGVQAGFNAIVAPNFLLGVEADVSLAHMQGSYLRVFSPSTTASVITNIDNFGTARGRMGAVFDRVLVYTTGGLAFGQIDETRIQLTGISNGATPGTVEVDSSMRVGWTVGGGTEYALAPSWSLKAEYLYVDFGQRQFVRPVSLSWAEHNTTAQIGRFGVNYHFSGF